MSNVPSNCIKCTSQRNKEEMLEGGQNGQTKNYAHHLSFTRLRQNKAKVNTEKEQSSHDDGYEECTLSAQQEICADPERWEAEGIRLVKKW